MPKQKGVTSLLQQAAPRYIHRILNSTAGVLIDAKPTVTLVVYTHSMRCMSKDQSTLAYLGRGCCASVAQAVSILLQQQQLLWRQAQLQGCLPVVLGTELDLPPATAVPKLCFTTPHLC